MGIRAIIYQSATGYTYRYASALAAATDLPCYTLLEAKKLLPKGTEVVYLGWVRASVIQGLKKALRFFKIQAVAAVGMYISVPSIIQSLTEVNKIVEIPFFYLRGGISLRRSRGLDHAALYAMSLLTARIAKKDTNPTKKRLAQEMTDAIRNGADYYDECSLEPIVQCIQKI